MPGKIYIFADSHLKHAKMRTYCDRPDGFTQIIDRNMMNVLKPEDHLIHVGDVGIGPHEDWVPMILHWPGKKTLVRGNHDTNHSPTWWLAHGFDSVNDGMIFRGVWITHKPSAVLPEGCTLNLHGHLHNIWHGFHPTADPFGEENTVARIGKLKFPHQRLFACEYTNYMPVEWNKFFDHAERYQATGPNKMLDNDLRAE